MQALDSWIHQQYCQSAAGMLRSIGPARVHTRAGFGQRIVPQPGAVVASPVPGAYDPDPDYYFHWYRDSALVIDALRCLHARPGAADGADAGAGVDAASLRAQFASFVRFSLQLGGLDGRRLVAAPGWRESVQAAFTQYLRTDTDLAAVHGDAVLAETRVNADGTLDISRWGRPQHDGPALRALTLLRWLREPALDPATAAAAAALLRADLDWVLAHGQRPCVDLWEEEYGWHYYTLRVGAAALLTGADWLEAPAAWTATAATPPARAAAAAAAVRAEPQAAAACRNTAHGILGNLDSYWLETGDYYRSRTLPAGQRSTKELDIAVILAAIHADDPDPHPGVSASASASASGSAASAASAASEDPAPGQRRHGVGDPRMWATLARLEALFERSYPINQQRRAGHGPAMGRYEGDHYYSGGAYYFSTLGAAQLCYRAAATVHSAHEHAGAVARDFITRGDAFLQTVRAYTPADGALSEQFDQRTGAQTSAPQLAWSHAAFITCIAARRRDR